jgi:hypothetical protein
MDSNVMVVSCLTFLPAALFLVAATRRTSLVARIMDLYLIVVRGMKDASDAELASAHGAHALGFACLGAVLLIVGSLTGFPERRGA